MIETAKSYPDWINLFSEFHSKTQKHEEFSEVLLFVKSKLYN